MEHDKPSVTSGEPAPIDPQLRAFISELKQAETNDVTGAAHPLEAMRRQAEATRAPWRQGGPTMASIEDMHVTTAYGSVHVRLYYPKTSCGAQPGLVYLHGGGWTHFSLDTHDRVMREYASRADMVVIGVDYSLSPEAKFPLALNEIVGVMRWLADNGANLDIDATRLAIGGDSAGANLAVGATLVLRDADEIQLVKSMLLIYGCFSSNLADLSVDGHGSDENLLSSSEMAGYWKSYLASPADARNPLASPSLARLDGLPPTFQVIAQCDVLAAQNRKFASRLRAARVEVRERQYAGATHSFLEAVSVAAVAQRAFRDSAAWLRARLHALA